MAKSMRPKGYRIADESLLDAESLALIDVLELAEAPHYTGMSVEDLRAGHEAFFEPLSLKENDLASVTQLEIDREDGTQMRVWLYRPKESEGAKLPILIYCHGGGMMVGSLEGYDTICHRLCAKSGVAIASVDYRLTPEHRYPAAHDDCYLAVRWIFDNAANLNLDPVRMSVGGDSGGGLLAAAAARRSARGNLPDLSFQLLIYPFMGRRRDYASYTEFQDGYFGSTRQLDWFLANYLNYPDELNDPNFSPILADTFAGLPDTFVLTAGYDMLRDEGEHYAELLEEAGVPVKVTRYASTFHPFLSAAEAIDVGKQAIDECANALARFFSRNVPD
jgi:acetyl esterase